MRSSLFVCYSNIMCSPMVEAVFRHSLAERNLQGVNVISAGLQVNKGREAHALSQSVPREVGIPLTEHVPNSLPQRWWSRLM